MLQFLRLVSIVLAVLMLSACQSTPQADAIKTIAIPGVNSSHLIENVPFFPQQQYYCGPTVLSEVFHFYGQPISPQTIASHTFLPNQNGSLQLEMIAASRKFGFLPYSKKGSLLEIFTMVQDDIPVIVFQNLSLAILPQWHYALVIGFDLQTREIILHTGVTESHKMSFELFERTWGRADYWYLSPLVAGQTSESLTPFKYINAAYTMLRLSTQNGHRDTALINLKAATSEWPDNWLAYFLLGNHYLDSSVDQSVYWFNKGYEYGRVDIAYVNNFSIALSKKQAYREALSILDDNMSNFSSPTVLLETRRQIEKKFKCVAP